MGIRPLAGALSEPPGGDLDSTQGEPCFFLSFVFLFRGSSFFKFLPLISFSFSFFPSCHIAFSPLCECIFLGKVYRRCSELSAGLPSLTQQAAFFGDLPASARHAARAWSERPAYVGSKSPRPRPYTSPDEFIHTSCLTVSATRVKGSNRALY